MQKKTRMEWLDTAKGIGLLLVIFGHLYVPYLATWIYLFHMPLFFRKLQVQVGHPHE